MFQQVEGPAVGGTEPLGWSSRSGNGARSPKGCSPFLSAAHGHHCRAPSLPPNTELGRFRIHRHIGSGSIADVYVARDTTRAHDVAIKVIDVGPCTPGHTAHQLQQEQSLYNRVQDHRHVLKVYDLHVVPWHGTMLMALSMEYADGGDFRQWLLNRRSDVEVRASGGLEIFKEICRGVGAIHEAGIVHLDVKPENCLFVHGILKVADFSLSRYLESLAPNQPSGQIGTNVNPCPGTPAYMSPEHFDAPHPDDLDARSDIYSLGVVLYEILNPKGRPPFGGDFERLRYLHTRVTAPPLPDMECGAAHVLSRCLAKHSAQRYACVAEILDDLEHGADPREPDRPAGDSAPPDETWEHACRLIEHGRFNDALRLCGHILEDCPEHSDAKHLREAIEDRLHQADRLYGTIEEGMNELGLDELLELLSEAASLYPEHPSARVIQMRVTSKARLYRDAMQQGLANAESGTWEEALPWFEKAEQLCPGGSDVVLARRRSAEVVAFIRGERTRIDLAVAEGDRDHALALARRVDQRVAQWTTALRSRSVGERS